MSVFDENIHPTTPQQHFDLLVDGELSEADRRALLLQLEHEPDGWRRCALAFLEAQCWKVELGEIAAPVPELIRAGSEHAEPVSPAKPIGRRQSWRQYAATILTIAASFLIALVVGMGLRGNWSGGSSHSFNSFVQKAIEPLPSTAAGTANDWEMVTLVGANSSDGRAETFRVPAQRRDALDQGMLENIPDAISPEVQQAFERSGHRVVQQREIIPVQMKDGRRLVVPVDHVEIHYVGRPSL
jgi:hypothetical protein